MRVEVVGVYPAEASVACHLVELWVRDSPEAFRVSHFTQEQPGQPRSDWQVPYDEYVLNEKGTDGSLAPCFGPITDDGDVRLVFFMESLAVERPLLTPAGPINLPAITEPPARLDFIQSPLG